VGGAGIGFKPKLIETSSDLEPQKPILNPPYDSIDHISHQPSDLGLQLYLKPMIKKYKKMQPQKMSLYRKIGWFLNKKRGRNDLFLIYAPLISGMLQAFSLFKAIK
jgi:hypothetical protein